MNTGERSATHYLSASSNSERVKWLSKIDQAICKFSKK